MTKETYLRRLEAALASLAYEDRSDALQYYNEYFEESPLTEDEVSKKLGEPETLAKQIIAESKIQNVESMDPSPKKGFSAAAAIILAIFAIPIGLPLVFAMAAVVLALLISVFALVFSFFITAVVLIVVGFVLFIASFFTMSVHFLTSIYSIGGALILLGLGILLFYATYKINNIIISFIISATNKILRRRKK